MIQAEVLDDNACQCFAGGVPDQHKTNVRCIQSIHVFESLFVSQHRVRASRFIHNGDDRGRWILKLCERFQQRIRRKQCELQRPFVQRGSPRGVVRAVVDQLEFNSSIGQLGLEILCAEDSVTRKTIYADGDLLAKDTRT